MRHSKLLLPFFFTALAAAGCSDGASATCDADDLRARLAAAATGDTISVTGECTLAGPFEVPAGVTLAGDGRVTITAAADGHALVLTPGSDSLSPTTVRGLAVESDGGCAAILGTGAGHLAIRDVDVRATTGVGIAVEGASSIVVDGVTSEGPVTAADADATMAPLPPFVCGSGDIATHGMVFVDAASVTLTSSSVTGFGRFGMLSVRSGVVASSFDARDNLATGIEIWGGSAELTAVGVDGTRDGISAVEVYGALYGGGAVVDAAQLSVTGGDGYGVFADGAMATHDDLSATDNAFAGVWAQNTSAFTVGGAGSMIARNGFAGVALLDSEGATIADATIRETRDGIAISGVGTVTGADGLHVVASDATLSALTLLDNGRVGAVLDLGGATTARVSLTGVSVDASGDALGVVAQNGTVETGWDDDVTRLGDTPANDAAFTGSLGIASGVGPPCLPPLDGIDSAGIAALVGL